MRVDDVIAIGWRAHAALQASAGEARVLAPLSVSVYIEAGGEVLLRLFGD